MAFSPDGGLVAYVADDTQIRLAEVGSGASRTCSCPRLMEGWLAVNFLSDRELVFVAADGRVVVWDVVADRPVRTIGGRGAFGGFPVSALSDDGRWLATMETTASVVMVDLERGEVTWTFRAERAAVWSLGFSRDGRRLAVGTVDGELNLWDLARVRSLLEGIAPEVRPASGLNGRPES